MINILDEIAWKLCGVIDIDIEQARTLLSWMEDEGLTDYDMMKE